MKPEESTPEESTFRRWASIIGITAAALLVGLYLYFDVLRDVIFFRGIPAPVLGVVITLGLGVGAINKIIPTLERFWKYLRRKEKKEEEIKNADFLMYGLLIVFLTFTLSYVWEFTPLSIGDTVSSGGSTKILSTQYEQIDSRLAVQDSLLRSLNVKELRLIIISNQQNSSKIDSIQDNLTKIETKFVAQYRQHQAAIEVLEGKTASLEQEKVEGKTRETRLQGTIQVLESNLEQKEIQIAEAGSTISELKVTNAGQAEEIIDLRQTYYVVDTVDELQSKGICDRTGGFLGLGQRTIIDNLDPRSFNESDVSENKISVGKGLIDDYTVLSSHKNKKALYDFEQRDDGVALTIKNPEQFWEISRFLVIEVKR